MSISLEEATHRGMFPDSSTNKYNYDKLYTISQAQIYGITDYGISSYGGHNPKCACHESTQCSKEMHGSDKVCYWHSVRMGTVSINDCGCGKKFYCYGGDVWGRRLFCQFCETFDINSDSGCGVVDMGGFFCCSTSRSDYSKCTHKCGTMYLCKSCNSMHDSDVIKICNNDSDSDEDSDEPDDKPEDEPEDEPEYDGNITYVPPGIIGYREKIGKGKILILYAHHQKGQIIVDTYQKAMTIYMEMQKNEDPRAIIWYSLATNMKDKPHYIESIKISTDQT